MLASIESLVAQGARSPGTAQTYRVILDVHVRPVLGEMRLRELSVARLDRFVQTVNVQKGAATAKLVRTVVSGALGLAVRYGAITTNPARDIGRITVKTRRPPRALSPSREGAVGRPTRCRSRCSPEGPPRPVLLDARDRGANRRSPRGGLGGDRPGRRLVAIEYTIIRVKGVGLVRKSTKSVAGERTLRLPEFVMGMLRRRQLDTDGEGPLFPHSRGRVARSLEHLGGAAGGSRVGGLRLGHEPRVPQDRRDRARRGRPLGTPDRRPARPLQGVDDPGQVPGPAGRHERRRRCPRPGLRVRRGDLE